jgi:predicted phosphoadenosine phosphosulfate sulfurtransferase
MYRDDVTPYWIQVPFRMFNATSQRENWLQAWDPAEEEKWVHPQDPISYKDNIYGTDRFYDMLDAVADYHFDEKTCVVCGIRCEESPGRRLGLTQVASYKFCTWHAWLKRHVFSPIYDWTLTDVWHAIAEHGWTYCTTYDSMHQYGIAPRKMRVSHLHHEMAVQDLFFLQELEPETYVRLCNRLEGIDMAAKFAMEFYPRELPHAFGSWREYRDYLLDHLAEEPYRSHLRHRFREHEFKLSEETMEEHGGYMVHVRSILLNDWEAEALGKWTNNHKIAVEMRDRRPLWQGSDEHNEWLIEGRRLPKVGEVQERSEGHDDEIEARKHAEEGSEVVPI